MKTKSLNKWLKKQAELLPKEEYEAFHKYNEPILQNVAKEGEEKDVQSISGELENHQCSHYRRLKRIYKSQGWVGVNNYFSQRGFNLIIDDTEKE